jgi:hypothetical protein
VSGVALDALNPAGCPEPAELVAIGADLARLVAFDDDRFFRYAEQLRQGGIAVAVVLARESFGNEDYGGYAAFYAERITPDLIVFGNEPDGYLLGESPSSWPMDPPTYASFWGQAAGAWKERQPEARCVIAGLVSGQPSYLDELLTILPPPVPAAVDLHPYNKGAADAAALLDLYRRVGVNALRERLQAYRAVLAAHGLDGPARLFVMEWNQSSEHIADYEAMLREEAGGAAWFCWESAMVPGFGLLDHGEKTPEYHAFAEANMSAPTDQAPKSLEEAEKRTDWQLGPRWLDAAIATVGEFRIGTYTYGLGVQRGPDVWQLPDVAATSKFFRPAGS